LFAVPSKVVTLVDVPTCIHSSIMVESKGYLALLN
jgi:hypothetical protein